MRRANHRCRRKWAWAGAFVVVTAGWIVSLQRTLVLRRYTAPGYVQVFLGFGAIGANDARSRLGASGAPGSLAWEWSAGPAEPSAPLVVWPALGWMLGGDEFAFPLWIAVCALALPTAYLFYADARRRAPGLCPKCRYDRAGLAAGAKCPECGAGGT